MRAAGAFLPFVIVAVGGYEPVLPDMGLGVRISVAHGVFLSNVILFAYLWAFGLSGGLAKLAAMLAQRQVRRVALLLVALGLLGMVSAAANQTSVLDFGQAARLVVVSVYFVLLAYWSGRRGPTFVLRAYLLGMACGGLVNLYYTFTSPRLIMFGSLPVLESRNGSGGILAIGLCLGAWLWMIGTSRGDRLVAIGFAGVGLVAVALSFSKTAMLIGLMGALAWLSTLLPGRSVRSSRTQRPGSRLALSAAVVVVLALGVNGRVAELARRGVETKFANFTLESRFGITEFQGTGPRYAYWPMTFKVLAENPVLGVGYSGLYDAYAKARKGYEDIAVVEAVGSRGTNPHNSFLYYIGANGLFALLIVVLLFMTSLRALARSCRVYGLSGRALWACMAGAYVIYGFTLPTLFNTEILYLPVAVAIAHARGLYRRSHRGKALSVLSTAAARHVPLADNVRAAGCSSP